MKKLRTLLICLISCVFALSLTACSGKAPKYTVTFDSRGGSAVASQTLEEGDPISKPKAPVKDMFVFDNWYSDEACTKVFSFGKMPARNITVYANWTIAGKSVTVSYNANGGEFADGTTQSYDIGNVGEAHSAPTAPVKTGYTFGGWYSDPECKTAYTFGGYPANNVTLYAGWNKDASYAYATLYVNGEVDSVLPVKKDAAFAEPEIEVSGLIGEGWFTDAKLTAKYTFGGKLSADIDLYTARYTKGLKIADGVVTAYDGYSPNVVVPNIYGGKTVTTVGENAFYRSSEINPIISVELPDTVTEISARAFYDCRYLVSVNLSDKVTEIGDMAFHNNERLKTVGDISSVTSIGDYAFTGCSVIDGIVPSEKLKKLGVSAFAFCNELRSFVIPSGINTVNANLFDGCALLERVEIKTATLTEISAEAFKNCRSLVRVDIASSITANLEILGGSSPFVGCGKVTVYVKAGQAEHYNNNYGSLDNGLLKDKFVTA